ncbi:MAG TPA: dephospho-CoA kinase [Thermoanaerobaculia bacterium]|jgi:dephospho-CoA kinase
MLRVGLTGGLASGKSTVARMLREEGAEVFDADEIVRGLYAPGGAGEEAARELFGEAVSDRSGGVDRAKIAAIVFADPARRHALEARIHPLVAAARDRRFQEAQRRGAAVAVGEASQLFEARSEGQYDRILLVIAPEAERLKRWEAKGGDVEDARRRMASQLAPSEAFDRADDVLVNDGSLEELRRRVAALYESWTRGAAPGRTSG